MVSSDLGTSKFADINRKNGTIHRKAWVMYLRNGCFKFTLQSYQSFWFRLIKSSAEDRVRRFVCKHRFVGEDFSMFNYQIDSTRICTTSITYNHHQLLRLWSGQWIVLLAILCNVCIDTVYVSMRNKNACWSTICTFSKVAIQLAYAVWLFHRFILSICGDVLYVINLCTTDELFDWLGLDDERFRCGHFKGFIIFGYGLWTKAATTTAATK